MTDSAACVCGHARVEHRPFGGLVAYAECHIQDCHCNQFVVRPPDAASGRERHVHPLTPEEHFEVVNAVKSMISVLPEGDDLRGEARARLVSALDKLEAHWCAWCPPEVRDLYAEAYNVVVNQGSERLAEKLASLTRSIPYRVQGVDEHFRETNEYQAKQPICTWLDGCRIGPGGRWHDPECPVEIANRRPR